MARTNMARTNLQIAVASYTGDGNDNRALTDLCDFEPQLVIVKGGANNAYIKTDWMKGDSARALAQLTANEANMIQGLCSGGMVVGSGVGANENTTTYYAILIRGLSSQDYFRTFRYTGNGSDDRNLNAIGFTNTPNIVLIAGNTTQRAVFKTTSMAGDVTARLAGSSTSADEMQSLISNGVQLGTAASVNSNTLEYFGVAMKAYDGVFAYGTYTGTGAGQTVSTNFPLDWLIVKNGSTTNQAVIKTSDMGANQSYRLSNANVATTHITAFGASGGFTVGSADEVDKLDSTYYWIGGRAGNFNIPIIRTAV